MYTFVTGLPSWNWRFFADRWSRCRLKSALRTR